MKKVTVADKVLGTIFILFGFCGAIGTLLQPMLAGLAKAQPQAAQIPTLGPVEMAVSTASAILLLIGGIGMWLAGRWGHMLVVLGCAAAIAFGAWHMVSPVAGSTAANLIGGAVGIALDAAFAGYCVWRLSTDKE